MGVTGVPAASATHAVDLARLAVELGPLLAAACEGVGVAPGRLLARVGLHSGPVTAGVLRTDRARFQIFGDTGAWPAALRCSPLTPAGLAPRATGRSLLRSLRSHFVLSPHTRAPPPPVNTASRMESTGQPGRVQASEATAALLTAGGAAGLRLVARPGGVEAKGKGRMATFWLLPAAGDGVAARSTAELRRIDEQAEAAAAAVTAIDDPVEGGGAAAAAAGAPSTRSRQPDLEVGEGD